MGLCQFSKYGIIAGHVAGDVAVRLGRLSAILANLMTDICLTGSNDNSLKVNCHLEYLYWLHAVSGRDQQIQFEFSNTGDNHYVGFDSW